MEAKQSNLKTQERIFLLCDQCFWTVTCLDKKYLDELSDTPNLEHNCPNCKKDQLSSFPINHNDSYRYSYSKRRGVEITFGINR
ncbi:hypothetical protein BH18THE1_BH18THE1_16880 [soil metagenome]